MKKIQNNPHEQTLVMNQTEEYKLNQKLNNLLFEVSRYGEINIEGFEYAKRN